METTKPTRTISQLFEEFLADQKGRISAKTFSKYQSIIQLYGSYLENYWPGHDGESSKITKAGGTYCSTFGPEDVTGGYSEFLGYFMPRKVMCGKDLMQAAGTVTKKLAKWLAEKGYIEDTEDAQERAGDAAKDLPNAQTVLDILNAYCDEHAPAKHGGEIEDHFWIDRIEPGKLWLNPLTAGNSVIGPISVPKQVTALCEPGWDIGGVVAKVGKGWRLVEVWNVSPWLLSVTLRRSGDVPRAWSLPRIVANVATWFEGSQESGRWVRVRSSSLGTSLCHFLATILPVLPPCCYNARALSDLPESVD